MRAGKFGGENMRRKGKWRGEVGEGETAGWDEMRGKGDKVWVERGMVWGKSYDKPQVGNEQGGTV